MKPRGSVRSTAGVAYLEELSPLAREEGGPGGGERGRDQSTPLTESGEIGPANVTEEFLGAGTVLGEMGVLEKTSRVISIECETPVRVSQSTNGAVSRAPNTNPGQFIVAQITHTLCACRVCMCRRRSCWMVTPCCTS